MKVRAIKLNIYNNVLIQHLLSFGWFCLGSAINLSLTKLIHLFQMNFVVNQLIPNVPISFILRALFIADITVKKATLWLILVFV